jgi:hypothetical protein
MAGVWGGTLMRHFLLLANSIACLPGGMGQAPLATDLILLSRPVQRFLTRLLGTFTGTVNLATITVTADNHLLSTASTVVESRGMRH